MEAETEISRRSCWNKASNINKLPSLYLSQALLLTIAAASTSPSSLASFVFSIKPDRERGNCLETNATERWGRSKKSFAIIDIIARDA
jgi:hypothetical protein